MTTPPRVKCTANNFLHSNILPFSKHNTHYACLVKAKWVKNNNDYKLDESIL